MQSLNKKPFKESILGVLDKEDNNKQGHRPSFVPNPLCKPCLKHQGFNNSSTVSSILMMLLCLLPFCSHVLPVKNLTLHIQTKFCSQLHMVGSNTGPVVPMCEYTGAWLSHSSLWYLQLQSSGVLPPLVAAKMLTQRAPASKISWIWSFLEYICSRGYALIRELQITIALNTVKITKGFCPLRQTA